MHAARTRRITMWTGITLTAMALAAGCQKTEQASDSAASTSADKAEPATERDAEPPTETAKPVGEATPAEPVETPSAATEPAKTVAPAEASAEPAAGPPVVEIETSLGTIVIELNPEKAPITVENFLSYVDDKAYDGTIFHRVMKGFMIQGGGFEPGLKQRPTKAPIKNESNNGLKNPRGTIAMARTQVLDSATSQFFINHKDNTAMLDYPTQGGYCVFGKVVEGLDVVDKIAAVKVANRGPYEAVPADDVMIVAVRRK